MIAGSRFFAGVAAGLVLLAAGVLWLERSATPGEPRATGDATIVTTIRSEPRTFNPLIGRDVSSDLIGLLTQATLVRIDRETDQVEPWLAESWTRSEDGLTYEVQLHPGAAFCDGRPVTADDVAFSFRALYDEGVSSVLTQPLLVQGQPILVGASDKDDHSHVPGALRTRLAPARDGSDPSEPPARHGPRCR